MVPSLLWLIQNGQNIRVHGNGFIQIDVGKHERVHVFGHPAIPRQNRPTPIHDHRFGFVSSILFGSLVNVVYAEADAMVHSHEVCNYKLVSPHREDTMLLKTGKLITPVVESVAYLSRGNSYSIQPRQLHETFSNEPTITHMRKNITDVTYLPRVLCRVDHEVDNMFSRHKVMSDRQLWSIVEDTFKLAGDCGYVA